MRFSKFCLLLVKRFVELLLPPLENIKKKYIMTEHLKNAPWKNLLKNFSFCFVLQDFFIGHFLLVLAEGLQLQWLQDLVQNWPQFCHDGVIKELPTSHNNCMRAYFEQFTLAILDALDHSIAKYL